MVTYEYFCEKCEIVWEKMWKKAPEDTSQPIKCDECGGECKRAWVTPPAAKTSMPWEGTGRSAEDYVNSYRREITDLRVDYSRKQANVDTATGESPYTNIQLNKKALEETGRIRKLTPEEKEAKKKNLKMTKDFCRKSNVIRKYVRK